MNVRKDWQRYKWSTTAASDATRIRDSISHCSWVMAKWGLLV